MTGHLLEGSRIRESVSQYEVAYHDAGRLFLRYRVLLEDRNGDNVGFGDRAVSIPISSLLASPAPNIDALPLERMRPRDVSPGRSSALALLADAADHSGGEGSANALLVEVDSATGRHKGFRLVGEDLDGVAHFDSGALHTSHHAWWAFPLFPFAVGIDLALLLPQIPAAVPLFVAGE